MFSFNTGDELLYTYPTDCSALHQFLKQILIIGKYISNTECARFHISISFPIPFNLIPHVPILKISHQIWKEPFLSFSRYFSPIFYNAWELWVFCLENFFCFYKFCIGRGIALNCHVMRFSSDICQIVRCRKANLEIEHSVANMGGWPQFYMIQMTEA